MHALTTISNALGECGRLILQFVAILHRGLFDCPEEQAKRHISPVDAERLHELASLLRQACGTFESPHPYVRLPSFS